MEGMSSPLHQGIASCACRGRDSRRSCGRVVTMRCLRPVRFVGMAAVFPLQVSR